MEQITMTLIVKCLHSKDVEIAPSKTEVVVVTGRGRIGRMRIQVNANTIETKNSNKYQCVL